MQVMFEWDDLRCLLAVQRHGTLAAAGAALGLNPTTVGRRVASLQEDLGATLLERQGRGYVLNDAGQRLLVHAQQMEQAAHALSRAVGGEDQRLAGTVRVSTTEMLATRFIAPYLHRFARAYPHIDLEVVTSPGNANLERQEADVALRLTRPKGDHLAIRRLLSVDLGLYAGKRYLERVGTPPGLGASFAGHDLLGFSLVRGFRRENAWLDAHLPGARIALRASSVSAVFAAAVGGMGIALLPRIVADPEPWLVEVAPAEGLEQREVWQVVHRDLRHAARIRAVLDFLAEVLQAPPRQRRS